MAAKVCLVLGDTGTGKSYSTRSFADGEVTIINVEDKPLPYRNHQRMTRGEQNYITVNQALEQLKAEANCIVVDDSTFLMMNENFERSDEKGYDKFTQMAKHYRDFIRSCKRLDDDTTVYIIGHIETTDAGAVKVKTIGKMLDEKYSIPGEVAMVLQTTKENGEYQFATNDFGLAKFPPDMLDARIPNDLVIVDDAIREYYGMAPRKNANAQKNASKKED